ncbi:unnamed protein product [Paramecium pentaurelia]|uniref:Transmembrane protein n=1 Tax=Paramecium pentaurelia TaxID=43138 RepID=A0A8S1W834_9CILI|nr:unnamed protein product [Paramecium pentaurelia]
MGSEEGNETQQFLVNRNSNIQKIKYQIYDLFEILQLKDIKISNLTKEYMEAMLFKQNTQIPKVFQQINLFFVIMCEIYLILQNLYEKLLCNKLTKIKSVSQLNQDQMMNKCNQEKIIIKKQTITKDQS